MGGCEASQVEIIWETDINERQKKCFIGLVQLVFYRAKEKLPLNLVFIGLIPLSERNRLATKGILQNCGQKETMVI